MPSRRVALLAAAVLALAAGLLAYTVLVQWPASGGQGNVTGVAAIGGPFALTDQDGRQVTEADFRGRPLAIFFGFTFCPEVCPTTLSELSALIERLGPDADRLRFAFVSVDWERDGPEQLAEYMTAFDPRIRGLSGSQAQIEAIARAFRVYYKRVPTGSDSYTVDHTSSVFLMDAEGRFTGTLAHGEDSDTMLAKLRRLAAGA